MYEWNQDFEDGQTRAVCSKCGVPYRWPAELVKLDDGFFYCKRRCLEQTVKSRDRIIAQSRKRREAPPPKFVQPPQYAPDYFESEDWVLKTVLTGLATSTDPTVIGWGVRYLCDMVIEARRPARWITDAKAAIARGCNYLLTLQYGAAAGPVPTLTSEKLRYGGFASGTNLATSVTIIAGACFAKAYTILGTVAYLDAAARCAHFLRHMQCQNLDNNSQGTTFAGGLYHIGGFAESVSASGTITWTSRYNLFDTAGVWFLSLLKSIQGGSTVYGGVAGTDFTASTAATLDVMIAEATSFALDGAKDTLYGGQLKTGLSTTYPRSCYLPSTSSLAGLETWILSPATSGTPQAVLRGTDVALALFALDAAGLGATTVAAVFDWLMTFTPNPLNAAPAEDPQVLIGTLVGTYDPTIALANELDVLADDGTTPLSTEHVGTGYSWLAAGLLAPIASVRLPAKFKASKDALAVMQPSHVPNPDPQYKSINTTGYSGLAFQISGPLP